MEYTSFWFHVYSPSDNELVSTTSMRISSWRIRQLRFIAFKEFPIVEFVVEIKLGQDLKFKKILIHLRLGRYKYIYTYNIILLKSYNTTPFLCSTTIFSLYVVYYFKENFFVASCKISNKFKIRIAQYFTRHRLYKN